MKLDLYHNRSGVRDPVAAKAIREADRQPEHVSKAVELMKFTAGNLDCEVVGRIVLRDKKRGGYGHDGEKKGTAINQPGTIY